jgi:hypothetical protein
VNGTNFSPEDRCLLLLTRGRLAPEVQEEARDLMAQTVSWPRIVRQARAHGVLPLVTRNLKGLEWSGVPDQIRVELDVAAAMNAARNGLLVRELTHVLGIFGRAGVPVVPLKGVALADRLYGDITRRVCSDIDVLVPRHAVPRAIAELRAVGYSPENELWARPSDVELFLGSDIEAAFRRRVHAASPLVDLHWDITRRWRTDSKAIEDLWAEASPTTLWEVSAYRLSPEWELLYLVVHAVRHRWGALKWLVDIHDYCSAHVVDWDRLGAKADRFGWGRALRMTLGLCRALLGTGVPDALAQEAPRWALAQLHGSDGKWKDSWIPARVLDRRADRLRYVFRLLLQPTILERRIIRLPAALSLLYYVLRPLRLATRWARPIAVSTVKAWRSS